ncbi:MAG: cupin domain-containing protein [Pseudomonadota bacterium]
MSQVPVNKITVEKNPAQSRLDTLGVSKWATWQKEVSVFPWVFPEQEIAYILAGECVITPTGGSPVTFGKGDLVTFPAGMTASWEVKQPLHKHYQLDGSLIGRIFRRAKLALKL